jgi:cell shape-determining protein MreC
MKRPLLNSRRTLALLAAMLAITSLLPGSWVRPVSRPPRAAVLAAIAPIANGLKAVGNRLRPGEEQVLAVGDDARTRRLYEEMLARTRQLENHLRDAQVQIQELSMIRQMGSPDAMKLVDAAVATWGVATHTLGISRGQRDSLREGLVVVDGGSLVGRLSEVYPVSATVKLITAPRTSLQARVVAPDAIDSPMGLVVALKSDTDGLFHCQVKASDPVHEGDLAHLSDDSWPTEAAGFIVGRVTAIKPDPTDPLLRRLVTVKPLRPLPKLSRVRVMVPVEKGAGS